ncbi:MAG: ECF transporter S component [Bacillota bacterium]
MRSTLIRKLTLPLLLLALFVLLVCSLRGKGLVTGQGWGLISTVMVGVALILFYTAYGRSRGLHREVAVISVLGTIAALGRVCCTALPGIQPTTFIVIISGFVFGPRAGFLVGSTAALVSNFFLGQGPWTPWQMFYWGLAGVSAGLWGMVWPTSNIRSLAFFNLLWGYIFGWGMNLWFWTYFLHPLNWKAFIAACVASFWFDTLHAVGNVLFCLILGWNTVQVLQRFQRKLTVQIIKAGS